MNPVKKHVFPNPKLLFHRNVCHIAVVEYKPCLLATLGLVHPRWGSPAQRGGPETPNIWAINSGLFKGWEIPISLSCCSACTREDLKCGALRTSRCPLSLQRFFKAVDIHHLFSTLTRWAQNQAPWQQLWLWPDCVAKKLLPSLSGLSHRWRTQPVASVSSLALCIRLVSQEPILKAPSGRHD